MNPDPNHEDFDDIEHDDFFGRLAVADVPPAPTQIDREVHRRVNAVLLATHLGDLLLHVMPLAAATFARSVVQLMLFSLTGRYEDNANSSETQQL